MSAAWRPSPLVVALLARELQPRRALATAVLAVAAAALLGRQLATLALPEGVDAPAAAATLGGFGPWLVARIGELLAVPFGIAAAVLGVGRITRDHEAGWLPAVVAARPDARGAYLLGIVGAVTLATAIHWTLAALAFALAAGHSPVAALLDAAAALPGAAAFALSAAAYGVAWGALLRRRGPAAAAAAAGAVLPIAIVAAWRAVTGAPAPEPLARLLSLPLPPLAWHAAPDGLLRHALYVAALLVPLTLLAPRLVARHR